MAATKKRSAGALTVEDCDTFLEVCRRDLLAADDDHARREIRITINLWLDRRILAMRRARRAA